jgi:hypothetical protein
LTIQILVTIVLQALKSTWVNLIDLIESKSNLNPTGLDCSNTRCKVRYASTRKKQAKSSQRLLRNKTDF